MVLRMVPPPIRSLPGDPLEFGIAVQRQGRDSPASLVLLFQPEIFGFTYRLRLQISRCYHHPPFRRLLPCSPQTVALAKNARFQMEIAHFSVLV